MPICPICEDTGLLNSDSTKPEFCYCAAGKKARRQWELEREKSTSKPASFIDITELEQVNASVDALRASLLGSTASEERAPHKQPVVQLLYRVAHPGHEISVVEATQLYDLAKTLEGFFGGLSAIGRKR